MTHPADQRKCGRDRVKESITVDHPVNCTIMEASEEPICRAGAITRSTQSFISVSAQIGACDRVIGAPSKRNSLRRSTLPRRLDPVRVPVESH